MALDSPASESDPTDASTLLSAPFFGSVDTLNYLAPRPLIHSPLAKSTSQMVNSPLIAALGSLLRPPSSPHTQLPEVDESHDICSPGSDSSEDTAVFGSTSRSYKNASPQFESFSVMSTSEIERYVSCSSNPDYSHLSAISPPPRTFSPLGSHFNRGITGDLNVSHVASQDPNASIVSLMNPTTAPHSEQIYVQDADTRNVNKPSPLARVTGVGDYARPDTPTEFTPSPGYDTEPNFIFNSTESFSRNSGTNTSKLLILPKPIVYDSLDIPSQGSTFKDTLMRIAPKPDISKVYSHTHDSFNSPNNRESTLLQPQIPAAFTSAPSLPLHHNERILIVPPMPPQSNNIWARNNSTPNLVILGNSREHYASPKSKHPLSQKSSPLSEYNDQNPKISKKYCDCSINGVTDKPELLVSHATFSTRTSEDRNLIAIDTICKKTLKQKVKRNSTVANVNISEAITPSKDKRFSFRLLFRLRSKLHRFEEMGQAITAIRIHSESSLQPVSGYGSISPVENNSQQRQQRRVSSSNFISALRRNKMVPPLVSVVPADTRSSYSGIQSPSMLSQDLPEIPFGIREVLDSSQTNSSPLRFPPRDQYNSLHESSRADSPECMNSKSTGSAFQLLPKNMHINGVGSPDDADNLILLPPLLLVDHDAELLDFGTPFSARFSQFSATSRNEDYDHFVADSLFPKSLSLREIDSIVSLERSRLMRSVSGQKKRSSFANYQGIDENIVQYSGPNHEPLPSVAVVTRSASILKKSNSTKYSILDAPILPSLDFEADTVLESSDSIIIKNNELRCLVASEDKFDFDFSDFSDLLAFDNISFSVSASIGESEGMGAGRNIEVTECNIQSVSIDQSKLKAGIVEIDSPEYSTLEPSNFQSETRKSSVIRQDTSNLLKSGESSEPIKSPQYVLQSRNDGSNDIQPTPLSTPKILQHQELESSDSFSFNFNDSFVPTSELTPDFILSSLPIATQDSPDTNWSSVAPHSETTIVLDLMVLQAVSSGSSAHDSNRTAPAYSLSPYAASQSTFGEVSSPASDAYYGGVGQGFGASDNDTEHEDMREQEPSAILRREPVGKPCLANKGHGNSRPHQTYDLDSLLLSRHLFGLLLSRNWKRLPTLRRLPSLGLASLIPTVRFLSRIMLYDTYHEDEYDRHPDVATCNELTPKLAQKIKDELNEVKRQMLVHQDLQCYTHFF